MGKTVHDVDLSSLKDVEKDCRLGALKKRLPDAHSGASLPKPIL
jgi:hypothetical protein